MNVNSSWLLAALFFPLSVCISNAMIDSGDTLFAQMDRHQKICAVVSSLTDKYNALSDNKEALIVIKDVARSLEDYEKRSNAAKEYKITVVKEKVDEFFSLMNYMGECFNLDLLDLDNKIHRKFLRRMALNPGILLLENPSREMTEIIHQSWACNAESNVNCPSHMLSVYIESTEFENDNLINKKLIFGYPQIEKNKEFFPFLLREIFNERRDISGIKTLKDCPTLKVNLACSFIDFCMKSKEKYQEANGAQVMLSVICNFFMKDKVYSQEVVDTLLNHINFSKVTAEFAKPIVKFILEYTDIELDQYPQINPVFDITYETLLKQTPLGNLVHLNFDTIFNERYSFMRWKLLKKSLKYIPSLQLLAIVSVAKNTDLPASPFAAFENVGAALDLVVNESFMRMVKD